MKSGIHNGRSASQSVRSDRSARTSRRRGIMFAYFMVYLLVAGTTVAAAGLLLHVMFQSRTADAKRADGIRQLLRIDQQLRTDWQAASGFEVEEQTFTIRSKDQSTIVYAVDADRVQRMERDSGNDEIRSTDRFQFPKGSTLQFESVANSTQDRPENERPENEIAENERPEIAATGQQPANAAGVVFRCTNPVPRQKSATEKSPTATQHSTTGQTVEIFLGAEAVAESEAEAVTKSARESESEQTGEDPI